MVQLVLAIEAPLWFFLLLRGLFFEYLSLAYIHRQRFPPKENLVILRHMNMYVSLLGFVSTGRTLVDVIK